MTNYASTNEPENHDNDFPVMSSDDIADMVCGKEGGSMSEEYFPDGICGYCGTALDENGQCPADSKPVASAPANVERLEDIVGQRMIDEMLKVKQCPGYSIHTPAWERLFDLKLIDITIADEDADATIDILTERGAALVNDYQRRQAINHAYEAVERARAERQPANESDEMRTNRLLMQGAARIEQLEAENARLQSDLAAARNELNRAVIKILQLKDIIASK